VAIRRIVPDLTVDDPGEHEAFYTEVLGLQRAMNLSWIATYVSAANPTAQLTLVRRADATTPFPSLTVEVDSLAGLERAHAAAVARGDPIVHPLTDEPWGVRRFFVRDPNGVVINVMCHKRQEGNAG